MQLPQEHGAVARGGPGRAVLGPGRGPQQLRADHPAAHVLPPPAVERGVLLGEREQQRVRRQGRCERREQTVLDHGERGPEGARPVVRAGPRGKVVPRGGHGAQPIQHLGHTGAGRLCAAPQCGVLTVGGQGVPRGLRGQHGHVRPVQVGERAQDGGDLGGRGGVHREQHRWVLTAPREVQGGCSGGVGSTTGAQRSHSAVPGGAQGVRPALPLPPQPEVSGEGEVPRGNAAQDHDQHLSTSATRCANVCSASVRRRPRSRMPSAQAVSRRARAASSASSSGVR